MRRSLGAIVLIPIGLAGGCAVSGEPVVAPTTAVPELAVAPAELMAVGVNPNGITAFDGVRFLYGVEGALVGPHKSVGFDAVVTTTTITPEQAAGSEFRAEGQPLGMDGLRAAEGHEFLVLRAESDQTRTGTNCTGALPEPDTPATLTIRASERELYSGTELPGRLLLVSVPSGAEVTMVLEDAGRAQSLDLRSGERGEGAVALYYPLRTATLDREFRSLGQVNGVPPVTTVDMDGRLKDAGLLPYYPGRGWAARERAWLCVTLELVARMGYEEVTIDEAASFVLETPRGGTIPAEPGSFTVANYVTWQGPHNGTMLFNVSDSFEVGTLTFTPHGSVTLEQWEGTLTGLEPVSAPVRLDG